MQFATLALFIVLCHSAQSQKEKWVEPNAWAKEVEIKSLSSNMMDNGFCECNAGETAGDNQAAITIFKKFIRQLFNREKLEFDKHFSLYQRELLFTVLPAQLEKLEELSDPRDLDVVLTEIFGNARTPNKYNHSNGTWSSIFALIWDILKDLVMLLRFSEVQFLSFAVLFAMVVWFIHRRHNVGIIIVVLGGFLVFGYFATYLECNRELELKQMLEVIEKNEATKPSEPRWYTPLVSWWGSSEEEVLKTERREQIKKASKLNLAFCRPDYVLMLYGNELFLKQLEFLIEKCTTTMTSLQGSLSFPFNYIAPLGLLFIIGYTTKLTFKYILSPRVWSGYFKRSSSHPSSQHREALPHREDSLSGENLKALIDAIKPPQVFINNSNTPMMSCVQDLPAEPLEALKESDTNDKCNNSKNNNSNTSDTSVSLSSSTQKLSSPSVSMETVAVDQKIIKESDKSDCDVVFISQVKTKVSIEDLPED